MNRDDNRPTSLTGITGAVFGDTRSGLLRLTLLFGGIAIAFAMIIAPLADRQSRMAWSERPIGVDSTATGSIHKRNAYTIRKSVLQRTPNSVCIIRDSGRRSGDC